MGVPTNTDASRLHTSRWRQNGDKKGGGDRVVAMLLQHTSRDGVAAATLVVHQWSWRRRVAPFLQNGEGLSLQGM